jgi:hypothetical protein
MAPGVPLSVWSLTGSRCRLGSCRSPGRRRTFAERSRYCTRSWWPRSQMLLTMRLTITSSSNFSLWVRRLQTPREHCRRPQRNVTPVTNGQKRSGVARHPEGRRLPVLKLARSEFLPGTPKRKTGRASRGGSAHSVGGTPSKKKRKTGFGGGERKGRGLRFGKSAARVVFGAWLLIRRGCPSPLREGTSGE